MRFRFTSLACLVLSIDPVQASTTVLRIGFDDYCPYTCIHASQKGFAIDVLEHILMPRGFKIEPVIASWPRIKSMARKGKLELIVPVNQMEANELGILRTQQNIGSSEAAYFVHKDSVWSYKGTESLQSQIIGVVQGYTYPKPLSGYLGDPQFKKNQLVLASDHGNQRQIKMLAAGRVSVVPSERIVFWYMAYTLGIAHKFKEAGVLVMPPDIALFYFGITTKKQPLSQDLVKWLDQGVAEMKRTGQFDEILKRYGIGAPEIQAKPASSPLPAQEAP